MESCILPAVAVTVACQLAPVGIVARHSSARTLLRQIGADPVHSIGELTGGNLDPLPALRIPAGIVWGSLLAPRSIESCKLRWANSPIAALLPRYNVEMEVRDFLSTVNPIVLEGKYPKRRKCSVESFSNSPGRNQYSAAFRIRKIQQSGYMPARDNAALARFKLPRIDYGHRVFAFFYDLPAFIANSQAKIAGLTYGKFDHMRSLIGLAFRPSAGSGITVRNDSQQVGDADINTRLEQQRGRLAAMVGLVVEEMLHQGAEVPAVPDARHVRVGETG